MKLFKITLKTILWVLSIPVLYVLIALLLSSITVGGKEFNNIEKKEIYLSSNGVHLDIVIPFENVSDDLKDGLQVEEAKYLSFGWGDENFYLNTPTWGDLTFKNAMGAMFLESTSLVHLTRHFKQDKNWVKVALDGEQLHQINEYIQAAFLVNPDGSKMLLENKGYGRYDDFYKAHGSYSCFKTCNSWVNTGFKISGLKSCYWTPFDFGLLNKYKN